MTQEELEFRRRCPYDALSEKELVVIEATAEGIKKARETEDA